jgi:hypothetical protein
VFSALGNFIWICNDLGRYGLILESNKEIYQKILEPLLKELKVEDDIFQDLHNTNSNSNSKESNSQTWLWVSLSFSICVTLFYTSCINSRLTMLFHCCRVSSHMRSWAFLSNVAKSYFQAFPIASFCLSMLIRGGHLV